MRSFFLKSYRSSLLLLGALIVGSAVGLILFFMICDISFAETIRLKSGQTIEGKVVKRTDELIKVDVDGGTDITYYFDEIDTISLDSQESHRDMSGRNEKTINSSQQPVNEQEKFFEETGTAQGVASAIDKLFLAKLAANDSFAQRTLRILAVAVETFATVFDGKYPSSSSDLTEADPPFVEDNYCGKKMSGYMFQCDFNEDGYIFTAAPIEFDKTGTARYTIVTGGILTSESNPSPESIVTESEFDRENLHKVYFFPKEEAQRDGAEIMINEWDQLSDFQKSKFVSEYFEMKNITEPNYIPKFINALNGNCKGGCPSVPATKILDDFISKFVVNQK